MRSTDEADVATTTGPEAQVSTLELFFDLVFVFGFTQITGAVTHDATALGLARGVLVFAVLWWAWGAYAWLTNTVATGEIAPGSWCWRPWPRCWSPRWRCRPPGATAASPSPSATWW